MHEYLNKFRSQISELSRESSFITASSDKREVTLREFVDTYSKADPANTEIYQKIAADENFRLRHALGEGPKIPSKINIELPKNYENLDEESKVSALKRARSRQDITDPNDYLNQQDNFCYANSFIDYEIRIVEGADTGPILDKFLRVIQGCFSDFEYIGVDEKTVYDMNHFLETRSYPKTHEVWQGLCFSLK